jgi:hypothetical protein
VVSRESGEEEKSSVATVSAREEKSESDRFQLSLDGRSEEPAEALAALACLDLADAFTGFATSC